MKPKEITEFKCHVCANSFKTESEKNNHIQSNHNTQIRTCSKCDLKFNEMTMVEWLTVRSVHEINDCLVRKDPSVLVNTLKCTFCDFKSNEEGNIEKHMKGNHEGLKYECDQCDHNATLPINLININIGITEMILNFIAKQWKKYYNAKDNSEKE